MSAKLKALLVVLSILLGVFILFIAIHGNSLAVLNPAGHIAHKERNLMVFTTVLGLLVVVPVYAMTIIFAWKYRASNHKAAHKPDWDHNNKLEAIWWGIPCAIIFVLAILAWKSSYALDPYKSLSSDIKPVRVQVVALQWKWLFIYPDEHVASVNKLIIPEKTPINFEITSDAPMNSFWIPKLGGQVYAMSGMSTKLHLMADTAGSYTGVSANISGKGFADMHFDVQSVSVGAFDTWVSGLSSSNDYLSWDNYESLAKPSSKVLVSKFKAPDDTLYDKIIMKYMEPQANNQQMEGM